MKGAKKFMFVFLFSVVVLGLVGFAYAEDSGNSNKMSKVNSEKEGSSQNSMNSDVPHKSLETSDSKSNVHTEDNLNKSEKEDKIRDNRNHSERDEEKTKDKSKKENETEFENETKHFFIERNGTKKEIRVSVKFSEGEVERELEFEGYNVSSKLKLDINYKKESKEVEMKVNLSNGQEKEIKILPNVASQTAMNIFKNRNITVELKEVKKGNGTGVIYEANSKKNVRLFGLFNVMAPLKAQIDSETGKVLNFNKPWWYFLVSESSYIKTNSTTNGTIGMTNRTLTNFTTNESLTNRTLTNFTTNESLTNRTI